jgi:hypothetical protein
MALVTRPSTNVSNYAAQPRVLTSGYIAGANDTICTAAVGAVSTDSIGSIYQFGFLPSGVRIEDILLQTDATTAGVWSLGIYTNGTQGLQVAGPGQSIPYWNSATTYTIGQVVQYLNVIYYCSTGNTGSTPPSGNWTTGATIVNGQIPVNTIPIPNAQLILGQSISTAAASATWKPVYSPQQGSVVGAINTQLRVWELAGFSSDPFYEFLLCLTSTTAPTANGNIALQWEWVR